jgi:hypothetical protein
MRSNLMKTKLSQVDLPATSQGPKPGNYILGSAESRAAARAILHRPGERDLPLPGDIFLDLGMFALKRAEEVYRALGCLEEANASRGTVDRTPSGLRMWLKFPEGFDPTSLPKAGPPLSLADVPEDVLDDVLRCFKRAFRKAKQDGHELPPYLDPDLVWNGTAHVPASKTPQQISQR